MDENIKDTDKTVTNEEDTTEFENDLDNSFGEDEPVDGDVKTETEDESKGEDKKETKDEIEDSNSSAVAQKKKYREKYQAALKELEELKAQRGKETGTLTPEQQKEREANDFLEKKIRAVLENVSSSQREQELKAEKVFQEELNTVLEDNPKLDETKILDVCEELGISPKQAIKVIERESKLKTTKEKPKLPKPTRASTTVDDTTKDGNKRLTLDEINRSIKDRIRKGLL